MSNLQQAKSQTAAPNIPSSGHTASLPYGSGDVAYAPAMAYAMIAKLMGKELELSNLLNEVQSDQTKQAMYSASEQAKDTRSSAFQDSLGQSISGSMSLAQGGVALGSEAYLTKKQSSLRADKHKLQDKLSTVSSKKGLSSDIDLKANEEEKTKLKRQIEEKDDKHSQLETTKDTMQNVIQGVSQFSQATTKAGTSIQKSNADAEAALEQTYQQSYKQNADEMNGANQSVLQTLGTFLSANFAQATAV